MHPCSSKKPFYSKTGPKAILSLLALISWGCSADVIYYSDEAEWINALGTEEFTQIYFDGAASTFSADSAANSLGPVTLDVIGGQGDSGPTGLTGSGFLQGEVDAGSSSALSLTFNFPSTLGFALLGLQNDSLSTASGLHLEEIGIAINGEQWLISDLLGLSDSADPGTVGNQAAPGPLPFLGFVSDSLFDQFSLVAGETLRDVAGNSEEFYLTGLQYAISADETMDSDSVSVPEPSPLLLMLLGLLGLFAVRRLRSPVFFEAQ